MCRFLPLLFTLLSVHAILGEVKLAPTIELSDGNRIPVVALGTGRGTAKESDTVDVVRHAVAWALKDGYRHIDTAEVYEDEEQVGQGIADAIQAGDVTREDVFVTTKLWSTHHAPAQVIPALKESLKKLGLTYVDLYLVHFPTALDENSSPLDIDYLDTWKAMEDAKRQGLAKSIGVSNFNKEQVERLIANSVFKPVVNQIEVSPTFTQIDLVNDFKKLGVQVMAYSPFGFLVTRQGAQVSTTADQEMLQAIANKYGKSIQQITLRYLLDRGLVIVPKSTNRDRIRQNIDLFDFKLSDEEVSNINKLNKDKRVITFDGWEDYPYYPFEKNQKN